MNLSFRFIAFVAATALAIGRPAAAQTNLVLNGGFEQSPIFAFDTTGWVPLPCTGPISTVSHTGARSVAIGDPAACEVGNLSQRLATTPGTNYTISFWAMAAPAAQRPATIGLAFTRTVSNPSYTDYFAGNPWTPLFAPTGNWAQYTISAQATSAYTVLQFGGVNTYLDDVTVTAPEPASVALLASGLIPIGLVLRRRR